MRRFKALRSYLNSSDFTWAKSSELVALVTAHMTHVVRLTDQREKLQLILAAEGVASVRCCDQGHLYSFARGSAIIRSVIIHDDGLVHWGDIKRGHDLGAYVGVRWWLNSAEIIWSLNNVYDCAINSGAHFVKGEILDRVFAEDDERRWNCMPNCWVGGTMPLAHDLIVSAPESWLIYMRSEGALYDSPASCRPTANGGARVRLKRAAIAYI